MRDQKDLVIDILSNADTLKPGPKLSGGPHSEKTSLPAPGPDPRDEEADIADDDASDAGSVGNQRQPLSRRRLLIALPALSVALFVSFVDQTSVSTSIPAISSELGTGSATSWIGASFLIASTAFQLVNGRLSDIFGRKNCLLAALALLALGDLGAGFARSKETLFAFRAVAGVGGGGVMSVVMIVVSDVTTLENRGKYQGIIGAVIALANGTGPFVGGALVGHASWRWVFWLVPMLAVPAATVLYFFLPLRHESGNYLAKAKKVDYGGVVLNLVAVLLILVPLSEAGIAWPWSSPQVLAMVTVGGLLAAAFVLYEWKLAPVPIMPLRLFKAPHCSFMYAQSLVAGICFYGNFFYLPLYFQSILGYTALQSGAITLSLIVTTSLFSVCSGQFMGRVGRYMPCIFVGFGMWTIGASLKCTFGQHTPLRKLIVILMLEGSGVGMTLQPTLLGLLANSKSEDRAVVTGLRNFIRNMSGAFGLVISGAILSNTLSSQLSHLSFVTEQMISGLTSSTYAIAKLGLTDEQQEQILTVYMAGLHYNFIFYASCIGLCFILSLGVGNTSLRKPKSETEEGHQSEDNGGAIQEEEQAEEHRIEHFFEKKNDLKP